MAGILDKPQRAIEGPKWANPPSRYKREKGGTTQVSPNFQFKSDNTDVVKPPPWLSSVASVRI